MGLFINTNQSALSAQRQLNNSTSSLSTSFERLSSGLRINGAKDDAAGLSITTRFSAQIRGLNQAVRNSNDGISLAQTAEGALNETTNILQRIRELAVQAANDTNNDSDRASLNAEVSQLKDELNRIAETTSFNGNKVLDGTFLARDIQVGANVGETLSVSIAGAGTSDLARQARYDSDNVVTVNAINGGGDVTINGTNIRATGVQDDTLSTSERDASAIAKAAAINSSSDSTGVRAIVGASSITSGAVVAEVLDETNFFELNGTKISGFSVAANDADGKLRDAINAVSDDTGVTASLTAAGALKLTAADGRNIEVDLTNAAFGFGADAVGTAKITLQSEKNIELGGADFADIGFAAAGTYGVNSAESVANVSIAKRTDAVKAIDTIDLALENVSSSRAKLGALQNRLESTINNLSTTSENLSASRSRILDADFAAETAKLSRNQIIQQAGVSILAQANQQPQVALALLG